MEKSLRWFKMRTVKNYVGIILCACVIIFIYKTFDISLFSNILSAFIPLIVGAILAYFLQPLVYKFEMFLDSFQNKKLIKYSHTISSILVFVVFVLIIVVLMIAIIPALVNYIVNIADNLTLYIKNFEKCKAHNLQMLEGLHSPVIDAYRNFLSNWNFICSLNPIAVRQKTKSGRTFELI